MPTHLDEEHRVVIAEDEARGGVTGHNVRYVLAYSMTGVIAAFALIAIYFGFDRLQAKFAAALAQNPSDVIRAFAPNAAIVLAGAIGAGLVLGIWNIISGRSDNDTQSFMRFRIAAQFALVCVIMAILYVSQMA